MLDIDGRSVITAVVRTLNKRQKYVFQIITENTV